VTTAVRELLNSFDTLSEAEKQAAASEILRRTQTLDLSDLQESALVEAADELFQALDAEEARHAQP
jgi:hypothetical protein